MAFSWKSSVKIAGDRAELLDVALWLSDGVGAWSAEVLVWLLEDGPEPSIIAALDLVGKIGTELTPDDQELDDLMEKGIASGADAEVLQSIEEMRKGQPGGSALTAIQIRAWRDSVGEAAKQNVGNDTWNHTADLDGLPLTIQVLSSQDYGRWSSFTLAVFSADKLGEDKTLWFRFEPQTTAPCSSWVIVSSTGHIASFDANSDRTRDLDVQQRSLTDEKAKPIQWGSGSVGPAGDGINLVGNAIRMTGSKTRIRSFDLHMLPKGRSSNTLVFQAKAAVTLRPFLLNVARPCFPLARLVLSRKINRSLVQKIDKMMTTSDWPSLVVLARRT